MLLTNCSYRSVFWRTFNTGDTVYLVGHTDGWLGSNSTTEVNHPHGRFQMAVKSDATGHPFLSRAGGHYSNDDEVIITKEGGVVPIEKVIEVSPDPGEQSEVLGSSWFFFDKRNFTSDTTDEFTTAFSLQQTTNNTVAGKITNSSTAENASGGSAEVTGTVPVKGVEIGLTLGATAPEKVTQVTARELTHTHGIQFQTSQNSSAKFQIPIKAGRITAIEVVWNRTFRSGRTTVAGTAIPWTVTTGLGASRAYREYAGLGEMPRHVYEAFLLQFPLSGTSLFRQGTPMMVDGNTWIGLFIVDDIQPGGGFRGTIYSNPMQGSYSDGFGDLQFVRTINPAYTQFWYAQTTNPNRINGYFTETIDNRDQLIHHGWSMAQSLLVTTDRGEVLRFSITRMDDIGRFAATLGSVAVNGSWDHAAQRISFNRPLASGGSQAWSGGRIAGLTFQGTYPDSGAAVSWTMKPD